MYTNANISTVHSFRQRIEQRVSGILTMCDVCEDTNTLQLAIWVRSWGNVTTRIAMVQNAKESHHIREAQFNHVFFFNTQEKEDRIERPSKARQ
jgi:hypothetical protein